MSLVPDAAPYRVLARKYRPASFDALIGQEAVVTTLGNAIARNRLAQAWLLTGVRGVGKTSTARLIAKALNCIGTDGSGGPTISPCGTCANCTAIAAGQHIDVIEMDAASNTGVDNIREIIEAVRYVTVSARYKVYIVDEVHMLSKGAFNALLKTLEEPPPHVKFIFATTEVQKVPATILSRCQRFDLKRVPAALLAGHFGRVAQAEGVEAEPDALALIARAADGSVRDGLSILDQAIAQAGDGPVTAESVREMLGLADRGRVARLMAAILEADAGAALELLDQAHAAGIEPDTLLEGLLEMAHAVTRARLSGEADPALGEADRAAVLRWAGALGFPALHRLWQLLLKGHADVVAAPDPRAAADMAILRCIHAAGLPDPGELARQSVPAPAAGPGATTGVSAPPAPAARVAASPPVPATAEELAALAADAREPLLAKQLTDDVAVSAIAPGELRLAPLKPLPAGFAADLKRLLDRVTALSWQVRLDPAADGAVSLREAGERARQAARAAARADPLVEALMATFPTAELVAIEGPDSDSAGNPPAPAGERRVAR